MCCMCIYDDSFQWDFDYMCDAYYAVCCSELQCVAVCCSVLQCVAVCCSVSQCVVCVYMMTHSNGTLIICVMSILCEYIMAHSNL